MQKEAEIKRYMLKIYTPHKIEIFKLMIKKESTKENQEPLDLTSNKFDW